ncbi:cap-specific mRNA (nucleoside-2'-O-)-methyltransferase 1 isoform X1 [Homalodisca vitripennis]|uniref:cap-specific mRNA (nucleoside-2'-O-)-methyltransferase 1 isoform X1 n=1 Tax=Homalodisca vitripennis TaxID=197043 RepID=UPI001EEBF34D|nr:cap-specific mRNA (nucleoside-2'-O-)-methyltransferase 1 isoform X1 [Homalodisca vitripennis]
MARLKEATLSDSTIDSSDDDDVETFQNNFDDNTFNLNNYNPNRRSSDYEVNRSSLSESNRLSFNSDADNPLSDPESIKDHQSESNQQNSESTSSEEESNSSQQQSASRKRTDTVTFYKYGHPTKVVHKRTPDVADKPVSHKRFPSGSDSEEVQPKRSKYDDLARPAQKEAQNLDKAKAMMEKMGYKEGRGLGKHDQGRVAPVELSKQRGRRGLGLTLPGLEPADLTWDSTLEVVSVEEKPNWLTGGHLPALQINELQSWKQTGPRNLNIEEFTDFCDPNILSSILTKKSIFDSLDGEELRRARTRSNPFETIGKGMFLNRAAMKMANMDRVFDFMFTSPQTQAGDPMVGKDELLYFADVCAGPGGFSEYVLWRKKWRAKGFGFTLKGENDFKLENFFSGPCESFEPFYGVKDDGDVFDPANIESLMHFVMDNTQQIGVHFMMADGGFSVDGQENIQELLSKQLYLCQFLVALCIVRTGGHFVCKLFDIFSPFSVGLVYLMYRAFEQVCIHKPNTSRPANSERYIICKWKRDDCEPTRQYLFNLNKELCRLRLNSKDDITLCVAMEELTQDEVFYNYIVESNNVLGERQVVNLVKVAAFCRDMNLLETKQAEIRRLCLTYWNIPDVARRIDRTTPEELANRRLPNWTDLGSGSNLLSESQLENAVKSVFDWHCVPIANHENIFFFLSVGRNKVFRLAKGNKYWTKAETSSLELSPGTLVFGELVQEYQGEGKSQLKKTAFHIIDAISLGEENVSQLHYTERLKICKLFAESHYKSTRMDMCRIRVKHAYYLEEINRLFQGLTVYVMKGGTHELLLKIDGFSFQPKGVMFIKATKEPWMRHLSRSHKTCYYARPGSASLFDKDRPAEACAPAVDCIQRRLIWKWENGVGIHQEPAREGVLHKDQLVNFTLAKLGRR